MAQGFDLLGEQLLAAVNFALSGFNIALTYQNSVINEVVRCGDAFAEHDGRWFMDTEHLPGDPCIKSLAIDSKAVYLETSPLDVTAVNHVIAEHMLPVVWDRKRRLILDATNRRMLGRIESIADLSVALPPELRSRVLWTLYWPKQDAVRRNELIRFADLVWTASAYADGFDDEDEPGSIQSVAKEPMLQLKLQLSQQQRLTLEQRPMLSLIQRPNMSASNEMRMELQQLLALQHAILNMTPVELEAFTQRDLTLAGQKRTLRLFAFVLAGQVKRALATTKPGLTWRDARKIARTLINGSGRAG